MIEEQTVQKAQLPSTSRLLMASLVAFAIAVVVLITAILPAEFGVDPLGTGKALGLTSLSAAEGNSDTKNSATPAAPVVTGTVSSQPRVYKVDSQDFLLVPGQGFEMKYHMLKGAVMVYSWKADGNLMYEFHGEPDQKPNKDYYDSYELDDKVGKQESHGAFIAPSTGVHGWFWENKTNKEINLHLSVAGFTDVGKMYAGGPPDDIPLEDAK